MVKRDYKYGDLVHYSFNKFQNGFAIFICDRPEKCMAILEMQEGKITLDEVYYERFCLANKKDGVEFIDKMIFTLENQSERLKHQIESKSLRIERNILKFPVWEEQWKQLKEKAARYELPLKLLGKTKNDAPDVMQMKSRLNNINININRCKNKISLSRSQNFNMQEEIVGLTADIFRLEKQLKLWKERREQFLANF